MNGTYRIVVGVDGSPAGIRALRWAVAEAEARSGTVEAVTAWQWEGPAFSEIRLASDPDTVRAGAQEDLDAAVRAVSTEHPHATVAAEVVEGPPAAVLTHAAADADLLVLGSHGHSRLRHAVLGSVAEACMRAATCPVVVIPAQADRAVPPAELATRS